MNNDILDTFKKMQETYAELANTLINVDALTLTEAQVQIEKLTGYIISLQGQIFPEKMVIMQIDEFVKTAKSMIDKVQRSISQALKDKQYF